MAINDKQGFHVLTLIGVILVCCIVIFAIRSGQIHRQVLTSSVQYGLEYVYDRCVDTNRPTRVDPSTIVSELISPAQGVTPYLPSFVAPSNVLVSSGSVPIPSDQVLFAVEMPSGTAYGITGRRVTRAMDTRDIRQWIHRRLGDQLKSASHPGTNLSN